MMMMISHISYSNSDLSALLVGVDFHGWISFASTFAHTQERNRTGAPADGDMHR